MSREALIEGQMISGANGFDSRPGPYERLLSDDASAVESQRPSAAEDKTLDSRLFHALSYGTHRPAAERSHP